MEHLGNIVDLRGDTLPSVDIVSGGSPCQDLSIAGNRKGLAGKRSGLFIEQIRVIKEMRDADKQRGRTAHALRPRYMLWENVPGAFSSTKGKDFHAVLEETCRVIDDPLSIPRPPSGVWLSAGTIMGEEFSVAWRVLDAQYWGVPQRRKRIYLVADFNGHFAPKILFEPPSLQGYSSKSQGTRTSTSAPAGERHQDPHQNPQHTLCLNDQGGQYMNLTENISGTLRAQMGGHLPIVIDTPLLFENHSRDARYTGPLDVSPTICAAAGTGGNNLPLAVEDTTYCIVGNIIDRQPHNGGNGKGFQENISYTLTTSDRHAVSSPYQKVVGALCAGDQKGVGNQYVSQDKCVISPTQMVRRLTPLECERLKGFPDNWTHIPGASDTARYKALGNSIAIPCAEFVFEGMAYYLNLEDSSTAPPART